MTARRARRLAEGYLDLCDQLRDARRQAGLAVEDVADRTGWRVDDVLAFESGELDLTVSTLHDYCLAVGVLVTLDAAPAQQSPVV